MVETLKNSNVSVILVPGDLTKDGEKANHEIMAQLLAQLEKAGKRVFVVPGNHDILNLHTIAYNGSETTPVPSVTADEFTTIYGAFGYNEALYRDPASLTYIVSLNAKTWLLAMDWCRYAENTTTSLTGGKFADASYQWIKTKLTEAQAQGIEVFGMVHHGLIEHYGGQSLMFADPAPADQNITIDLATGMVLAR